MKRNNVRGLRNNNPGNIRDYGDNWRGKTGTDDKGFLIFDTPENGIRAITRILNSYRKRGVDTLEAIINAWAPPVGKDQQGNVYGNNTNSYINHVAQKLGIGKNRAVTSEHYPELIAAIILHENGSQPYSMATIKAGIQAA